MKHVQHLLYHFYNEKNLIDISINHILRKLITVVDNFHKNNQSVLIYN